MQKVIVTTSDNHRVVCDWHIQCTSGSRFQMVIRHIIKNQTYVCYEGNFNSITPFAKLGSTTLPSCVISISLLAAKRLAACLHLRRVLEGCAPILSKSRIDSRTTADFPSLRWRFFLSFNASSSASSQVTLAASPWIARLWVSRDRIFDSKAVSNEFGLALFFLQESEQ
jgi:hypothetical protein